MVRIAAACQAVMEEAIRRHPADWVWMHERWKTQPARPEAPGSRTQGRGSDAGVAAPPVAD